MRLPAVVKKWWVLALIPYVPLGLWALISISIMNSSSPSFGSALAGGLMFAFGFIALLVYTLAFVITLLITLIRRKKKSHSN
ncbi:hypothetical protein IHI26_01580 [Candidatus Parvarchaeota archaeon]|jgi:hypothetical protein|nr:hypothetical protein [Candidatus Acidifodinimicrobium mancum]